MKEIKSRPAQNTPRSRRQTLITPLITPFIRAMPRFGFGDVSVSRSKQRNWRPQSFIPGRGGSHANPASAYPYADLPISFPRDRTR
ncbi:hypothetical protein [Paraburkholderia xenovorans]|uniref:hypothetical protein n=1 Tax=Paraburkholderia xenovorans TaxID=36873 RepID=UPI0038B852AD